MTHSPVPASKRRSGATKKARLLRQNETEAEHRLWGHLRNRLLNGHKFARQVPLGPYIADFVCRERRLIVELDGSQHAESQRDIVRTRWLNANGYSVLRFWNHEVLQERQAVLDTIFAAVEGLLHERCEIARFYPTAVPPGGSEMAPCGTHVIDVSNSSPLASREKVPHETG